MWWNYLSIPKLKRSKFRIGKVISSHIVIWNWGNKHAWNWIENMISRENAFENVIYCERSCGLFSLSYGTTMVIITSTWVYIIAQRKLGQQCLYWGSETTSQNDDHCSYFTDHYLCYVPTVCFQPWCIITVSHVIMGAMASQITSLTIVYSTVYSRKNIKAPRHYINIVFSDYLAHVAARLSKDTTMLLSYHLRKVFYMFVHQKLPH